MVLFLIIPFKSQYQKCFNLNIIKLKQHNHYFNINVKS
jgi:hypothetical protein